MIMLIVVGLIAFVAGVVVGAMLMAACAEEDCAEEDWGDYE